MNVAVSGGREFVRRELTRNRAAALNSDKYARKYWAGRAQVTGITYPERFARSVLLVLKPIRPK